MEKILLITKENFKDNPLFYEDLIFDFYRNNNEFYPRERLNIADMIFNRNVFYTALLVDDKIVSLARFAKVVERKTIFMVRQITTLREYQGKGYGPKCIEAGYDYVRQQGGKKLCNVVDKDNVASIKMHEKCGFKLSRPTKHLEKYDYYWEGAYLYEKDLDEIENS